MDKESYLLSTIEEILKREKACFVNEITDRLRYEENLNIRDKVVCDKIKQLIKNKIVKSKNRIVDGQRFKFVYLRKTPFNEVKQVIGTKKKSCSLTRLSNEKGEEGARVIRIILSELGYYCYPIEKKSFNNLGLGHRGIDVLAMHHDGYFLGIESKNRKQEVDKTEVKHHIRLCQDASEKWRIIIKPVIICSFINHEARKYAKENNVAVIYTRKVFYPSNVQNIMEKHKRLTYSKYYAEFNNLEKHRLKEIFKRYLISAIEQQSTTIKRQTKGGDK